MNTNSIYAAYENEPNRSVALFISKSNRKPLQLNWTWNYNLFEFRFLTNKNSWLVFNLSQFFRFFEWNQCKFIYCDWQFVNWTTVLSYHIHRINEETNAINLILFLSSNIVATCQNKFIKEKNLTRNQPTKLIAKFILFLSLSVCV